MYKGEDKLGRFVVMLLGKAVADVGKVSVVTELDARLETSPVAAERLRVVKLLKVAIYSMSAEVRAPVTLSVIISSFVLPA